MLNSITTLSSNAVHRVLCLFIANPPHLMSCAHICCQYSTFGENIQPLPLFLQLFTKKRMKKHPNRVFKRLQQKHGKIVAKRPGQYKQMEDLVGAKVRMKRVQFFQLEGV